MHSMKYSRPIIQRISFFLDLINSVTFAGTVLRILSFFRIRQVFLIRPRPSAFSGYKTPCVGCGYNTMIFLHFFQSLFYGFAYKNQL